MSNPHFEIFDEKRQILYQKLSQFVKPHFFLTGGTAVALQIGHRKSFDFDFSLPKDIDPNLLLMLNENFSNYRIRPLVNTTFELSIVLDEEIKLSFFKFPFPPLYTPLKIGGINTYSLKDLASNKAYFIGRRGEWKDYVDMYFLMNKQNLNVDQILSETKKRFGGNFDEKLFWEQLVYWKDIESFEIEYVKEKVPKEEIQKYFENLVKNKFS